MPPYRTSGRIRAESYGLAFHTPSNSNKEGTKKTQLQLHPYSGNRNSLFKCSRWSYNSFLLSHLLAHKESKGDEEGTALLKQVSPVAWQHINLHGRYEFSKVPEEIDMNAIIHQVSQFPITQALAA